MFPRVSYAPVPETSKFRPHPLLTLYGLTTKFGMITHVMEWRISMGSDTPHPKGRGSGVPQPNFWDLRRTGYKKQQSNFAC